MKLNAGNTGLIAVFFIFLGLLFFHFHCKLLGRISAGLFVLSSIINMFYYYKEHKNDS